MKRVQLHPQEAAARVVIAREVAAGLDPGRLDPVFDPAGGSRRTGGVRINRQGSGEAAEGRDGTATLTG